MLGAVRIQGALIAFLSILVKNESESSQAYQNKVAFGWQPGL
jgi:hypothetical protein